MPQPHQRRVIRATAPVATPATIDDMMALLQVIVVKLSEQEQATEYTLVALTDYVKSVLSVDAFTDTLALRIEQGQIPHPPTDAPLPVELQRWMGKVEGFLVGLKQQFDNQQGTINALVTAMKSGVEKVTPKNTPANTPAQNSTPENTPVAKTPVATPSAIPYTSHTSDLHLLQKNTATPSAIPVAKNPTPVATHAEKLDAARKFYTAYPDASLNDAAKALGLERSTLSRLRKTLRNAGDLT